MSNATTLRQARESAMEAVDDASRSIENAASRGMRTLSDNAQSVREQARHAASTVRDNAHAVQERGRRYVAEEPGKSVLMAVAVGALIAGLLVFATGRRRDG